MQRLPLSGAGNADFIRFHGLGHFLGVSDMMSFFDRALLAGTALALLASASAAFAQSEDDTATQDAPATEEAVPTANGATLLPRLDVGAGAEGTVGTNVIAITQDELEKKQPSDLQEVFSGEPGVAVGGAIPSTQKIFVNGVDETNLAVTVDGSRQNNKVFHHNGTYLLDPALLKAVTVQPGVAPADAGPAALGGSMGFETVDAVDLLEPGRNFGGFISGTFDTNSETYTTGISAYGMKDGFEFLGYLNYSNGGNFTAGNGQEMPGTGTDLLSGLGKLAYETEEGHRFEISHEQVRDDEMRPYRANFYFNRGLEPEIRRYELNRQNTVFTYDMVAPVDMWDPKIVLAYSRTQVETPFYDFRTGEIVAPAIGTTASFNGKVENKFAFDIGSVTAGVDFYNDKAHLNYDAVPPELTTERASNIGAYAQARLEPFDRTRISFGGRADHQWFTGVDGSDWTNAGVSGNISGEYDLLPDFLTVKAGAARVWGGVPLAENFIHRTTWTYGTGPEPVTSVNLTGGLEARFDGFTVEAGIFQTDIRNARFPSADPNRSYDLDSWGWEIGAGYDWGPGFVRAKYVNVYADVDGIPADTEVGRYLTTPVGEIIMLTAGYTFENHGVTIGADAEFGLANDRTLVRHPSDPGSPKVALPAYEVVNAFVEYTPPQMQNITLRAEARNIFDEAYTSRASYGQDFDGVMPHLEPGRTFRFNARVRF